MCVVETILIENLQKDNFFNESEFLRSPYKGRERIFKLELIKLQTLTKDQRKSETSIFCDTFTRIFNFQ